MSRIREFASRYQVVLFLLLTYLLSWSLVIPLQGGLLPHGPMIAAFIVLGLVAGRRGMAELWRQMTKWRVAPKWYVIAPGIVIAFHLCAFVVSLLLGARVGNTSHLQALSAYLGVILPLVLVGGMWEEPGWTGYLLRRFESSFAASPLLASLAVGVFRMIWHTPLLVYGVLPWYDYVFYTFAVQLLISWLYHRTHGSVLIVMLFHMASNVVFSTMYPLFTGAAQGRYFLLFIAFAWVFTAGILVAGTGQFRRDVKPAEAG